jgi:hypothetical protein
MGLDVSHDCWHGGYGSFNMWRDSLAKYAKFNFELYDTENGKVKAPAIDWKTITQDNLEGIWKEMPSDPLWIIIAHYDCDGIISKEHTKPLYERLEQILKDIPPSDEYMVKKTTTFIEGLKDAHLNNEDVTFA